MRCFDIHKKYEKTCKKNECRYWINCKNSQNCTLISAKKGSKTLEEIGKIFGITRMRVCQIEKKILSKMKNIIQI